MRGNSLSIVRSPWFHAALIIVWLGPFQAHAQHVELVRLGFLNPNKPYSYTYGCSADGTIAVGWSSRGWADVEAFYWTKKTGMVGLGYVSTEARDISGNGRVIVGTISPPDPGEAMRWTAKSGPVAMGKLPGSQYSSIAWGTNYDGSVVVGQSGSDRAQNYEAFRWTKESGMVGLGSLDPNHIYSIAFDASADGMIIVGISEAIGGKVAFRWTEDEGMVSLGVPEGWNSRSAWAYAISPDGGTIVGKAEVRRTRGWNEAVRWTQEQGPVGLGLLDDRDFRRYSEAEDVSANGWVIVGYSQQDSWDRAVVWTPSRGPIILSDFLMTQFGLDLGEFWLGEARAVSYDGKTIVGHGAHLDSDPRALEAYWLRLPCIDDCDQCSFTEHMKARCRADGEGTVAVTVRLSGAKPGAQLTFCLDYWKAFATATVKANGRAKVVFDRVPAGRAHHVTLKECDAPADAKCR